MILESVETEWVPDVLKETHHSTCGSAGRLYTPGVIQKMEKETRSDPWFKMLMASVKWRLRKAYKLEFNDKAKKQSSKLIQSERNSKTCCDSTLRSQQQQGEDFSLILSALLQ